MFYAPWCGHCKAMKPDFSAAATALKGKSLLAGMDVDQSHNTEVRTAYNISGFPTIYYFVEGKVKYTYTGEKDKDGIVKWMKDPTPPKEPEKEAEWSEEPGDVHHLEDSNFESFMAENPSVLVMFYAPWCGHCKAMKPDYSEAAKELKALGLPGKIAALDATKQKNISSTYEVSGYPTIKYFKDGAFAFEKSARTKDEILEFMKDPKEPPPPPPPEPEWTEEDTDVVHLTEDDFSKFLKKKKHVLVMFYAPWCGHCKNAKPHLVAAAAKLKSNTKASLAAVDCTKHQPVCTVYEVKGYPTFRYFNYGKNDKPYDGGRDEEGFLAFMEDPLNPKPPKPKTPPAEEEWKSIAGAENLEHLEDAEKFEGFIKENPSVLVMFYAPWCGHCKNMKPAYSEAAAKLKTLGISGRLAAVDATVAPDLAKKYDVEGYPTLKHFKDGVASEYASGRDLNSLVNFMKTAATDAAPEATPEATPEPEKEAEWSTQTQDVAFLTQDSFDAFVQEVEHVLVMFYAPWCGFCKKMKPAFFEAAAKLKTLRPTARLAAVDATQQRTLASRFQVQGYPTLKLFTRGVEAEEFRAGRTTDDVVSFMLQLGPKDEL